MTRRRRPKKLFALTVMIDPDLHRWLKIYAATEDIPIKDIVGHAITCYKMAVEQPAEGEQQPESAQC